MLLLTRLNNLFVEARNYFAHSACTTGHAGRAAVSFLFILFIFFPFSPFLFVFFCFGLVCLFAADVPQVCRAMDMRSS